LHVQLEDAEERAKQEAAKNFVGAATAPARHVDSATVSDEQVSDADEASAAVLSAAVRGSKGHRRQHIGANGVS